ncbi:MAG: M48 family metallopeptidase [Tepidisphaeraceae bacterium]|jgi:STE24 endopeptidase
MSRFLPLLIFAIWLYGPADAAGAWRLGPALGLFLGVYALLVLAMAVCSRLLRRTPMDDLQRRLRRFNRMMSAARILVPAWFAVGVYCLGWKAIVAGWLSHTPLGRPDLYTPGLLLGSLPAFLALAGLIWAQYPAERSLREQNILIQLNEDLPFCAPPGFWSYFQVKIRLQILFALAPAIVLTGLRDVLWVTLPPMLDHVSWVRYHPDWMDAIISLPATVLVLLLAPVILRYVLQAHSMPDSPLRRRLEEICRRHHIGYRDVLLWRTSHQISNAAVMGLIPQARYILLSDLLLETMSDQQIEAVFAHELGHVIHRHLYWLAAAVVALLLIFSGPGQWLADRLASLRHPLPDSIQWVVLGGGALAIFALVFGYVSRRFEQQADVFAARTIQGLEQPPTHAAAFVSAQGAAVFCSALQRIAAVNNIPVAAPSWSHGSIYKRMRFLSQLGQDPAKTAHFDRSMFRLYLALSAWLLLSGIWLFSLLRGSA